MAVRHQTTRNGLIALFAKVGGGQEDGAAALVLRPVRGRKWEFGGGEGIDTEGDRMGWVKGC